MNFDSHVRGESGVDARHPLTRPSRGAAADQLAARHDDLTRASAGNAVSRMLEIDAQARHLGAPGRLSWIERLFPSPAQRAQIAAEGQMAEAEAEFRLRALRMLRGVELQLLQDGLNAVRVQHSTALRGMVADRVFAELQRIVVRFGDAYDAFYRRACERIETADRLPYAALREDAYDAIADDLKTVRRVKTQLVTHFERVIDEEVKA